MLSGILNNCCRTLYYVPATIMVQLDSLLVDYVGNISSSMSNITNDRDIPNTSNDINTQYYKIQDTRYKIFYFSHEAHSKNILNVSI